MEFNLENHLKQVAQLVREKEAYMRRGDLAALQELDELTDEYLLRKWAWVAAIVGVIASFAVVPLVLGVIGGFLPVFVRELFWAFAKVSMGVSLLMFCAAIYFTMGGRQ